jgi:DDE superfamily endonuclease
MVDGLLMELEDYNCWSIAEAVGHRGPHRLQHLLSRAVWDDQQVLDAAAAWAVAQLDDGDAVLIVDETADEKSSADAVGAARQYCGTVGGIALCQVAITLTFATSRGHTLIDRALYLPEACAADGEHRELAGVPEEVMFATKPELAEALLQRAHKRGIRAGFATGDEVYGGRALRRAIRALGMGYVLARHIIPDQNHRGMQLVVRGGDQCGVVGFGHRAALALAPAVDADLVEQAGPPAQLVAGQPRDRDLPRALARHPHRGGVINTAMETGPTVGLAIAVSLAEARQASLRGAGKAAGTAASGGYGFALTVAAVAFLVTAILAGVALAGTRSIRQDPGSAID